MVFISLSAGGPVPCRFGYGMAALAGLIESTIYALKVNQSAVVRCFTPLDSRHTGPERGGVARAGQGHGGGGTVENSRNGSGSGSRHSSRNNWNFGRVINATGYGTACHP